MITRIRRLMEAEFLKLFAQPFFYVSLVIIAGITLCFEYGMPFATGQKETPWRNYNAVLLFVYGFKAGLKVSTYVLLIFSSMMFAGEFDRGTIKNLLTRPITRPEFFVAKCLAVVGLAAIFFGFVLSVSLMYALKRGDVGPVWDEGQYIIQRTTEEILQHGCKAVAMSFLAYVAAGFLGILISNFTESSGYSVAMALVAFIVCDLATGIVGEGLKRKFFMYYPTYALDKLTLYCEGATTRWNPDIDAHLLYVQVPLYTILVFIPAAFGIFRSRNITA